MATIIAVTNQKGGVAKTTTTLCLGSGLAEQGYRVLLIDLDPQGSLSICLGCEEPEKESYTMADIMSEASMNPLSNEMVTQGIFSTEKRIDYIPANWKMASVEMQLVKNSGGETVLRQVLNMVEQQYDFVLLDCPPTLGMTTLNALVAADKVLIPVQPEYLAAKGLEQLLRTIVGIRRNLNPQLQILGILETMMNRRTKNAKEVWNLVQEIYGRKIRILNTAIPYTVKAKEINSQPGIFGINRRNVISESYRNLVFEVLGIIREGEEREL